MKNLFKAVGLAVVAAVLGVAAFGSDSVEANHLNQQYETQLQYLRLNNGDYPSAAMTYWNPAKSGYSSYGVFEYCFNELASAPFFGGQQAFNEAAAAWTNGIGSQYFQFAYKGTCNDVFAPTQGAFHDCVPLNDGINKVYFVNFPNEAAWGCYALNTNPLNGANNVTGQSAGGDLYINVGKPFGSGFGEYSFKEIAMHELGHAIGLGHSWTDDVHPSTHYLCTTSSIMCTDPAFVTSGDCGYYNTCQQAPTSNDIMYAAFIYRDHDFDGCRGIEEIWNDVIYPAPSTPYRPYGRSDFNYNDYGDVQNDGYVNSIDLAQESQRFGPWPSTIPPWIGKDMNENGLINSTDLGQIAQSWNWEVTCLTMPNAG